jgi:hypothetical protein
LLLLDGVQLGVTSLLSYRIAHPTRRNAFRRCSSSPPAAYLRLKAGADPIPPLPFGQSPILGPAVIGSLVQGAAPAFYLNPQLTSVNIRTSASDGFPGVLTIEVAAAGSPGSSKTNGVMNANWTLKLHEPRIQSTLLEVTSRFSFIHDFYPSATHSANGEAYQLLRNSSMVIDQARHDVNELVFTAATGSVILDLVNGPASNAAPERAYGAAAGRSNPAGQSQRRSGGPAQRQHAELHFYGPCKHGTGVGTAYSARVHHAFHGPQRR